MSNCAACKFWKKGGEVPKGWGICQKITDDAEGHAFIVSDPYEGYGELATPPDFACSLFTAGVYEEPPREPIDPEAQAMLDRAFSGVPDVNMLPLWWAKPSTPKGEPKTIEFRRLSSIKPISEQP